MSAPLTVSVIMPAFNAAKYVREAVDSVLAQRFEAFELLVADDGSTDDTRAILDGYQPHPRVRVLHNPRNLGAAATRNRLIAEARGRYVTPCDADDIMLPGNLRCLSTFLDEHLDVGVVYADLLSLRLGPNDELVEPPTICGADCNKTWDLFENVVNHGGSMSRRDILIESGGYDEQVASVDDWSLWLRVAERTRIHYLQGGLYYVWRRHVRSMTRTDARAQDDTRRIVAEASIRRGFK
jgi:glycosyltransferase involved in cell wall biosynthesis